MRKKWVKTMMKHYKRRHTGEQFDKHPVLEQAERVETAFSELGHDVDLLELITPRPGSRPANAGVFITPNLPEQLETTLDHIGWLSVNEQVLETFEDDSEVTGSQELTNIVVRNDLTVGDVVEKLANAEYSDDDDTDMLTKVVHTIQLIAPEMPAVRIAAYDVLRKSLGWKAEKMLAETKDFNKMLASRDPQGYDLGTNEESPWDTKGEDGFQLKTHQRVISQSLHTKDHKVPHLAYQWTTDGIMVASMDEIGGTDELATAIKKDAGLKSKTIVKKSERNGVMDGYGRAGRVIAWE